MPLPQDPAPKVREHNKPCTYTSAERGILNPFRKAYETETNKTGRLQMFRGEILPAIFNFWSERGTDPETEVESMAAIKQLAAYIRNNWRRPSKFRVTNTGTIVVRRHDVVRDMLPERVAAAIKDLLDTDDEVTTAHPMYFRTINTAISLVSNSLTAEEDEIVIGEIEARTHMGYNAAKQRKLFERQGTAKVTKAASILWLEMGMVQFSFTAAKSTDGQWVIDVHDNIAKLMGVTAKPFSHSLEGKIIELQRDFLTYITYLGDLKNPTANPTQATYVPRHDLQITIDAAGFPMLPPPPGETTVQTKMELVRLLRDYINKHYYLASGRLRKSAPFKLLETNWQAFVDKEYIVPRLGLRDPNLYNKGELEEILAHIHHRQDVHGSEDAFQFKNVSLEGGIDNLTVARYGVNVHSAKVQNATAKQKVRRSKGKQRKTTKKIIIADLNGLLTISDKENSPTPSVAATAAAMVTQSTAAVGARPRPLPRPHTAAAGTTLDPTIDPLLQMPPNNGASNGSARRLVPNPLKRISENEYREMRCCLPKDYHLMPINGPMDGPPVYEVLPQMWEDYLRCPHKAAPVTGASPVPPHNSVPIIAPGPALPVKPMSKVPQDTRKRAQHANDLAREEAEKLIAGFQGKHHKRKPSAEVPTGSQMPRRSKRNIGA